MVRKLEVGTGTQWNAEVNATQGISRLQRPPSLPPSKYVVVGVLVREILLHRETCKENQNKNTFQV